ncbi:hypothetical protein PR202_gb04874 [Eleusine coracana subsp. coracana]|uniref:Uncharacterized protein n=1 Tax=Eleusine coracana subsp. coracana TaxID=191504 RepID=A0AAV5E6F8_ELECO|nr:hypothetical protein PR202_gb04874 [Eleusine coracana subsp. coracana]
MEGDDVFASMHSLWFYSSVFLLQPSSKQKQSKCSEEPKPIQQQDSTETHGTSSENSCQAPRCAKEKEVMVVVMETERRAVSRSCKVSDERVNVWLKKQRWRAKVVAMPAWCSPVPTMPPPDDGIAMRAHLRSWAHAVACSVR